MTEPKKPWEEEWSYDSATWSLVHEPQEVTDARNTGRAKLAAAAPDMARLLMTMEWSITDKPQLHYIANEHVVEQRAWCVFCKHEKSSGHKPDCEWVRVMRKAGVIE